VSEGVLIAVAALVCAPLVAVASIGAMMLVADRTDSPILAIGTSYLVGVALAVGFALILNGCAS
jgi:hypothetical protein